MIRNVLALVLLSLFVGLSGCAVVPGSNITQNQLIDDRAYEADMPRPAVSKITPLVIEQLRAQQPAAERAVAPQSTHYVYKIGPGDILTVTVWDHPELTTPYGQFNDPEKQGNLVRDDGTFYYPYIGDVVAAGKTTQELRVELMTALSKYIEAPQLDVKVAAFRSQRFYLTGAVEKPGTYPITDIPQTVLDAVNLSGGLAENADLYDITLTRGEQSTVVPLYDMLYRGDMSGNQILAGNDVIHIARNEMRRVFLMGEVIDSQSLPMTYRPLSLTQALSEVGGIREDRADGRGIYVIRNSEYEGIINVFQLDVSEAWAFALGDQFILEPRDVVYVSAAPITRWNRFVSNLLPSLQGLFNLDRIGSN